MVLLELYRLAATKNGSALKSIVWTPVREPGGPPVAKVEIELARPKSGKRRSSSRSVLDAGAQFESRPWYAAARTFEAACRARQRLNSRYRLRMVETGVWARGYDGECSGMPQDACSSALELSIVTESDWKRTVDTENEMQIDTVVGSQARAPSAKQT